MEHHPRTTRPVGAEAAAGGAPATTQAAQRLGSGVTDGHFWAPNHDNRRGHFSTRAVSKNVPARARDFGRQIMTFDFQGFGPTFRELGRSRDKSRRRNPGSSRSGGSPPCPVERRKITELLALLHCARVEQEQELRKSCARVEQEQAAELGRRRSEGGSE